MYSCIEDCFKFFVSSTTVSDTGSTRATPNYGSIESSANEQLKFNQIKTGEVTQQTILFNHQALKRKPSLPMPIPGTQQNGSIKTHFDLCQSHNKRSADTNIDIKEIFKMSQ